MNPTMMIRGTWSYRASVNSFQAGCCPYDDTGTGRATTASEVGVVVSTARKYHWRGSLEWATGDR